MIANLTDAKIVIKEQAQTIEQLRTLMTEQTTKIHEWATKYDDLGYTTLILQRIARKFLNALKEIENNHATPHSQRKGCRSTTAICDEALEEHRDLPST